MRSAIDSGRVFEVASGDRLEVHRDRDSRLNRNAVLLTDAASPLGYLMADAARALGPELDAGLKVLAEVVDITAEPIDIIVEIRAAVVPDRVPPEEIW